MEKRYYTVQEVSDLTNLAVSTLRKYTSCRMTDLVRGDDFYIHRYGRYRRQLFFTSRGLARLKTRSYHVTREPSPNNHSQFDFIVPARYRGTCLAEALARLQNTINLVIREYQKHPCAVPACPCMTHRLGLPQADEMAAMIQRVKDAKAARRGADRGTSR